MELGSGARELLERVSRGDGVVGALLCTDEGKIVSFAPDSFKESAFHYTCVVASMVGAASAAFRVQAKERAARTGGAEETEAVLGAESGAAQVERESLTYLQFATSDKKQVYVRTHDDLLLVVVSGDAASK